MVVEQFDWLFNCACIAYRDMKHLESLERTETKSQNDRPSPEIPHESRTNSRVPARVCDVEGGVVCSKNRHIWLFRWNRVDPVPAVSNPDYGSWSH